MFGKAVPFSSQRFGVAEHDGSALGDGGLDVDDALVARAAEDELWYGNYATKCMI